MKCLIPSKIKTEINSTLLLKNSNLTEQEALIYIKDLFDLCYNSQFREWFFKICPGKSTSQVLTFKKKDEKGQEYTETFSLGVKSNNDTNTTNDLTYSEYIYKLFSNETNGALSFDIDGSIPYISTAFRVNISIT